MDPVYAVSKFGKFMLSHKGYNLTMNRKPIMLDGGTKTYWKCTTKGIDSARCKATATSYSLYGVERAIFKGTHCHPAHVLPSQQNQNHQRMLK